MTFNINEIKTFYADLNNKINKIRNSIDRPLLFLGILLIIIGIQIFSIGFIAELIVSYLSKYEKIDKETIKSEN